MPPVLTSSSEFEPVQEGEQLIDPYGEYVRLLPSMAEMARFERENNALSYREVPFLVGSSLLGFNVKLNLVEIFTGANIKLHPKVPKHCAEMFALDGLMAWNEYLNELAEEDDANYGTFKPVGLVSVGTSDQDEIEGVTFRRTPTLHMCPECVNYYADNELVDNSLPISTFAHDLRYLEVHTLNEFKRDKQNPALGRSAMYGMVRMADFDRENKCHDNYLERVKVAQQNHDTLVPTEIARLAIITALPGKIASLVR